MWCCSQVAIVQLDQGGEGFLCLCLIVHYCCDVSTASDGKLLSASGMRHLAIQLNGNLNVLSNLNKVQSVGGMRAATGAVILLDRACDALCPAASE